ncbi:MAG: hypothetical protein H7098_04800 [Oligoflexus sp.]|nr:hypothetical protein [Pseudopedobacter sp.]
MMNLLPLIIDLNLELISLLKGVDENGWKRKLLAIDESVELAFKRLVLDDYKLINLINTFDEKAEDIKYLISLYENDQHKLNIYIGKLEDEILEKEYEKRWLSHQKIFNALNKQTLLQPKYYHPYLSLVLSRLPALYNEVKANRGDILRIEIVGDAGGTWIIKKDIDRWFFCDVDNYTTLIYIDQQIAWLLFSGLIDVLYATQYYQIHGEIALANSVLQLRWV